MGLMAQRSIKEGYCVMVKTKKIFAGLLVLALCLTLFPVASIAAAKKPAPPKDLKATAVNTTSVKLNWTRWLQRPVRLIRVLDGMPR